MGSPTDSASTTNPTAGVTGSSATKTAEPSTIGSTAQPSHTATTDLPDRSIESQVPIGTASTTTGDRAFPLSTSDTTAGGVGQTTAAGTVPTAQTSTSATPGTAAYSGVSSNNAQTVISPTQPADDVCTDTVHGGPHHTQIARKIDPCYEDVASTGVPATIGSANQSALGSTTDSAALGGATTAGATGSSATKTADPVASTTSSRPVDSQYTTLDPAADKEHHYTRDAAVGGAAGAGAGAVAGHEFSKKDAEKEVKHQQELEKKHEKEAEKQEKEIEKDQKKHEKELEKERKKQEKEEKPGLLDRLLHRDSKKDKHTEEAAAAGAGGAAGYEGAKIHEHNKLHKDPPAGYTAPPEKGYASQVTGGTGTTALASGNPNILPGGSTTKEPLPPNATVPGTRYGSGHDEHPATSTFATQQPEYYLNDPTLGIKRDSISAAGGTVQTTTPYQPTPQTGYASQVTGGTGTTQLAQGHLDPVTNPTKANPLKGADDLGYASKVTGGTGTTQLAQGTTTTIPTDTMEPGRGGSVAGVTTETPYVDGPKAGTGKYAENVTGGTGTTQLAQGQLDEVANPRKKSVAEKIEEALVLK